MWGAASSPSIIGSAPRAASEGGAEHPIELRRNHHVAWLQDGEQGGALGAICEGL
jgi:hypothetical protein